MFTSEWPTWRRDLLLVTSGMIFSAAALLPLGWTELSSARKRADAAEQGATAQQSELEEVQKKRQIELESKQLIDSQAKALSP